MAKTESPAQPKNTAALEALDEIGELADRLPFYVDLGHEGALRAKLRELLAKAKAAL